MRIRSAVFYTIARFELRYQLHNPVFWVATILFFLLTFGSVTIASAQFAGGGNVHLNSPVAIAHRGGIECHSST
ncbi:MAG TPA: hypothetical protein VIY68_08875 [Steroidobacteraceae bacterium]